MDYKAVIGCGYGDEGKGKVVSYLCSNYGKSLVVRFSGGQQAGHHVVIDEKLDHVFSNFGSGTLQRNHSYFMPHCTIDPTGILNEASVLSGKCTPTKLYIDGKCPVTTPYDKIVNFCVDSKNGHGTCGVGVGRTLQREEDHYSLLFEDLFFKSILKEKLKLIIEYYKKDYVIIPKTDSVIKDFLNDCEDLTCSYFVDKCYGMPNEYEYDCCIFEGSQGLMLDQGIGFFPHVTRGFTGTKNIAEYAPEVYLVTRAYQTRHGYGPLTNEDLVPNIKKNPWEQNSSEGIQGEFRRSILDLDILNYVIEKDKYISRERDNKNVKLVMTCLDLIYGAYKLTRSGEYIVFNETQELTNESNFIDYIRFHIGIDTILKSHSPFFNEMW